MSQLVIPEFEQCDRPTFEPIRLLHRGHDGYVSFHRKKPGTNDHQDLFSMKATDLEEYFPQLLPTLETNSYYTVNGMFRGGFGIANNSPPDLPLERAERQGKLVRWLTCCFADIDCHKLGIDVGTAVGAIINAQDAGVIPPASMLTRSGNGVWVYWFLHDENDDRKPQRAHDRKVLRWCAMQRRITDIFGSIGADAGSRDVARITRVVGSINSKSETRVDFWLQANRTGKPYSYTINDLTDLLQVELPKPHKDITSRMKEITDSASEHGRKGWRGRWLKGMNSFNKIWALRGTFKVGTRAKSLFVFVVLLRKGGIAEDVIRKEVFRLFYSLEQPTDDPYTKQEVEAILGRIGKDRSGKHIANQTISDYLDITAEEAEILDHWPPASRFGKKIMPAVGIGQKERTARRRKLIESRIEQLAEVPSLRDLTNWIESMGISTQKATIMRDLVALNIPNPRVVKRTRIKRAKNDQGKMFP